MSLTVALDRRLLVHLAAHQEGRRAARAGARVARRLVAARLRPRARTCSTTSQRCAPRGLTFAPEAGTQRMRDVVNKNVTEEQLMRRPSASSRAAGTTMKLYFMIGLPDRRGRGRARDRARRRARARGRQARASASAARPAEGDGQRLDARAQAAHAVSVVRDGHARPRSREKQGWLARRGARARKASKLRMHDADDVVLEGVFARGDRTLGDVLERAYRARRALRLVGRAAQASSVWEEALRAPTASIARRTSARSR